MSIGQAAGLVENAANGLGIRDITSALMDARKTAAATNAGDTTARKPPASTCACPVTRSGDRRRKLPRSGAGTAHHRVVTTPPRSERPGYTGGPWPGARSPRPPAREGRRSL